MTCGRAGGCPSQESGREAPGVTRSGGWNGEAVWIRSGIAAAGVGKGAGRAANLGIGAGGFSLLGRTRGAPDR